MEYLKETISGRKQNQKIKIQCVYIHIYKRTNLIPTIQCFTQYSWKIEALFITNIHSDWLYLFSFLQGSELWTLFFVYSLQILKCSHSKFLVSDHSSNQNSITNSNCIRLISILLIHYISQFSSPYASQSSLTLTVVFLIFAQFHCGTAHTELLQWMNLKNQVNVVIKINNEKINCNPKFEKQVLASLKKYYSLFKYPDGQKIAQFLIFKFFFEISLE